MFDASRDVHYFTHTIIALVVFVFMRQMHLLIMEIKWSLTVKIQTKNVFQDKAFCYVVQIYTDVH